MSQDTDGGAIPALAEEHRMVRDLVANSSSATSCRSRPPSSSGSPKAASTG
ncbi:hypothetical protein ACFQY5_08235 [Paeniroseomonas aquatica]|uniref:hypothetical protein n=1 Tax=Paeniroseomonas aquatica TaxID=373043 RepID=UPI003615914A